jgi:hypothetical protein
LAFASTEWSLCNDGVFDFAASIDDPDLASSRVVAICCFFGLGSGLTFGLRFLFFRSDVEALEDPELGVLLVVVVACSVIAVMVMEVCGLICVAHWLLILFTFDESVPTCFPRSSIDRRRDENKGRSLACMAFSSTTCDGCD